MSRLQRLAFIRDRQFHSNSLRSRDCLRIIEAATVPIRLAATYQANSLACKSLERASLVQRDIRKATVTAVTGQVVDGAVGPFAFVGGASTPRIKQHSHGP